MSDVFVPEEQARRMPTPPLGYRLVLYTAAADGRSGKFIPPIPVSEFPSVQVWIPDLAEWVKPKWFIGDESRWFAIEEADRS